VEKRPPLRQDVVGLHLLTGRDLRTCQKYLAGEPVKGQRVRDQLEKARHAWAELWPSIKAQAQEIAVS
jgi:hypothetical protein